MPEQGLTHSDERAFADARTNLEPGRREGDDRGALAEVTHLVALAKGCVASDAAGAVVPEIEGRVEKLEMDAPDKDGADGNEGCRLAGVFQTKRHDGPLVPAVQPLHTLDRCGV